jgi:hypothetical protein
LSEKYLGFMNLENDLFRRKSLFPPIGSLLSDNFSAYARSDLRGQLNPRSTQLFRLKKIGIFITFPELFINCLVSSRREFADGAEFGDMTQILRNLGSCPLVLNSAPVCKFSTGRDNGIHE